jgi:uncharacterized protein (TIGR02996 family)
MDHERAFLQAIRAEPDDDAHRLIYADWLEEQGGAGRTARSSFIRAQCRLAALPADDPARDRLEDEAEDLLAEHEDEWTQPLHGIAEGWRFSRGFIEHMRIRGENFLTHAERLFDFTPLRSLHLLIPRNDVPHLAACPQLQWIETLDFSRCSLNDRSLQHLLTSPYLDRLSALNLDGNDINTPGLRALVQSPLFARLRLLDLSRNLGIGDTAAHLLAQANPENTLEVLSLAGVNLGLGGLDALFQPNSLSRLTDLNVAGVQPHLAVQTHSQRRLEDFKLPPQLQSLELSDLHLRILLPVLLQSLLQSLSCASLRALRLRNIDAESRDAELIAQSPSIANLTLLDLHRNNLGAAGMRALADSPYLASLRHLNVSSNNIRDAGAKALAASPCLTRLRILDVSGNGIGGPGRKALVESGNLDHLRTLRLASNFIGVDSVRALAESAHLRNLTCLDLSDVFLEQDSARALASSANLTRLRTLLLKKNLLGDGGAKALAQSPHLARLTTLDLNDNRIGKAGAEALAAASWRRMRSLDLRGNVFTDTQEALLRDRFGDAVLL